MVDPLSNVATLLGPREKLDYFDAQWITLPNTITPLEAWNVIMATPLPGLKTAFRVRDAISARFGVARSGGFRGARVTTVRPGDKLDFFTVERATATQLILTARDTHLDVMISADCVAQRFGITASVITHNAFGRAYMLPVGPAHRLIVRHMLKRLHRQMR